MSAVSIRVSLALLVLAALPACAQEAEPARQELPFARWAAEGERADIRWDASLTRPALMFNQRQSVSVVLSLPMKDLQKRSVARELHTLIKVQDAAGRWLPEEGYDIQVFQGRLPSKARLHLRFLIYLRPGQYTVHSFLFDRVRQERSYARHPVRIPEIRNDPLPHLGRDLPVVEFVEWSERAGARRDLPGRLHLPVRAKRPLRLDIIVNFSARASRSGRAHRNNTQALLEMLGVLAQMEFPQGTVRLTALDVLGRRVLFQFDDVSGLDLPSMRDFLEKELNPHTVNVDTLARRLESAEFFRVHLERALQSRAPAPAAALRGGGEVTPEPDRVFLLLGAPTLFPFRTPVRRLELKGGCACRFFYLRRAGYRDGIYEVGVWDQLERILDPVDPRLFEIAEPKDLRKALAHIITALEQ